MKKIFCDIGRMDIRHAEEELIKRLMKRQISSVMKERSDISPCL
ncbi:hypothetical protein P4482_16060 [Neobacillus thermocopriae]|nr:hypothetical protein [Neobacillus thermocopriae]MED3715684.1 hypothetical protein [Neobacillus thermocopriae]